MSNDFPWPEKVVPRPEAIVFRPFQTGCRETLHSSFALKCSKRVQDEVRDECGPCARDGALREQDRFLHPFQGNAIHERAPGWTRVGEEPNLALGGFAPSG